MRKRQKSGNKKKGSSGRCIDNRDRDWLTPSERFSVRNSGPNSNSSQKKSANTNRIGPVQTGRLKIIELDNKLWSLFFFYDAIESLDLSYGPKYTNN